jgi:hypothetical protein
VKESFFRTCEGYLNQKEKNIYNGGGVELKVSSSAKNEKYSKPAGFISIDGAVKQDGNKWLKTIKHTECGTGNDVGTVRFRQAVCAG